MSERLDKLAGMLTGEHVGEVSHSAWHEAVGAYREAVHAW